MTPEAPRVPVLDVARGLAVVLVLGNHLRAPAAVASEALGVTLALWQSVGWIGVDLFFVLSGFLVAGLLFSEHRAQGVVRPWRFLGRRGFKIYPGFWLLLVCSWVAFGDRILPGALWHELLFVQNYLHAVWNHSWSLAVEEHFYFLLAISLWLLARFRRGPEPFREVPLAIALLVTMVLTWRSLSWFAHPEGSRLFATHDRLDAPFIGVALAWAWHQPGGRAVAWVRAHRGALLLGGGLCLSPSLVYAHDDNTLINTVGLTLNAVGWAGWLAVALAHPRPLSLPLRGLAWVGQGSYATYLWHMPVRLAVQALVERPWGHGVSMLLYVAGSIALGALMTRVFERPFLRWRDAVLPRAQAR